ncbi:MAG: DNA -binding domain-containing protein [Novosphingobium sp.]
MWTATVDPCVLSVMATSALAPDAIDIARFDPLIRTDADGEHVRVTVAGEAFRLGVISGSLARGPIGLTYKVARDRRLAAQIDTIRRLEQRFAGTALRPRNGGSRLARSALALRAWDGRTAGASLREMAAELLGPGDWPGDGEHRKSAIRRLLAVGERLVARGPLPVLAW